MLATQMVATHTRAMNCLHRATLPEQTFVAGKRAAKFLNLYRRQVGQASRQGTAEVRRFTRAARQSPDLVMHAAEVWTSERPGPSSPSCRTAKARSKDKRRTQAHHHRHADEPARGARTRDALPGSCGGWEKTLHGGFRRTAPLHQCPQAGAKHARGHRPQIHAPRPCFERPRKYISICSKKSDITTFNC